MCVCVCGFVATELTNYWSLKKAQPLENWATVSIDSGPDWAKLLGGFPFFEKNNGMNLGDFAG